MTGTEYKVTVNVMDSGCIQISCFNDFFYGAMKKIPAFEYTAEEMAFAEELFENVNGRKPKEGESVIPTGI